MNIPLDEILAAVSGIRQPREAFNALHQIGVKSFDSPAWLVAQVPDTEADVNDAATWLRANLESTRPTGVYLGLDTLNERAGKGTNIEIGMTPKADPAANNMDWVWDCERYGTSHLINGIFQIHRSYENLNLTFEQSTLADFLFFLGYSGSVLAAAIERVPVQWDCLFVWGFHDGNLAYLMRGSPSAFERLGVIQ